MLLISAEIAGAHHHGKGINALLQITPHRINKYEVESCRSLSDYANIQVGARIYMKILIPRHAK